MGLKGLTAYSIHYTLYSVYTLHSTIVIGDVVLFLGATVKQNSGGVVLGGTISRGYCKTVVVWY